jgi:hypothetical protein
MANNLQCHLSTTVAVTDTSSGPPGALVSIFKVAASVDTASAKNVLRALVPRHGIYVQLRRLTIH